jgi:sigma-54 dependent transcriptional regulator, flagellar regulatory protein
MLDKATVGKKGSGMDSVLVIDSDQQRYLNLKAILEFIDCDSTQLSDPEKWQEHIKSAPDINAVIISEYSDSSLPDILKVHKVGNSQLPLILIEDDKTTVKIADELATSIVSRIKYPVKYRDLTEALQHAQLYRDNLNQQQGSYSPELFRSLVGNSRGIRQVRKHIEQVAKSDATVLILGESGTGKEVVARNIHYNSSRRDKPFVPINCGAIPSELLESELFGHEKGAFTGAISARQGRFELAEGGTLFLDEIGDMSMHMQVKLLRVLQERTFERVGSNKTISSDVRIIAATHRNLEDAISKGNFREDLFYRLNVFPIEMPPLRDRVEDIPLLINELIKRLEHEKRGSIRLTQAAILALCQYFWPGNVRELANLIERLVIMHPYGVVDVHDLPKKFQVESDGLPEKMLIDDSLISIDPFEMPRLPRDGIDLKEHLTNLEYNLIKQALEDAGGVVAHAANRLRLRRTTLVEKLRKYGLQRSDETT